jgi:hypothetical protein
MKSQWLPYAILRTASLLAPGDQRAEWLDGWHSELWYIPRRGATRFCLGAFPDALWLRRNNLSPVKQTGIRLESPLACLAFLATLAAVSLLIAVRLPAPDTMTRSPHLGFLNLLEGCIAMLMMSVLILPAIRLAMGPSADRCPMPWRSKLRRGIFLALKIALVQPVMLWGFFVMVWIGPVAPVAPQLAISVYWFLAFRWVLIDQQRRCPVCLRLLTDPIRIGSASRTFLEWYGAESTCSRGHGLLHISETPASYSAKPEWLRLGDSWSSLFRSACPSSETAGVRQR